MKEQTKDKISKSMEGNKNAEKWTEPVVIDLLERMLEYIKTPIRGGYEGERVHLKKEVLFHFDIMNMRWFSEMAEKFAENTTVSELLRACACACEINSYKAAAYGAANPMIVKMNLSTHYGWADKTGVETKQKTPETEEELDALIKLYKKNNPEG